MGRPLASCFCRRVSLPSCILTRHVRACTRFDIVMGFEDKGHIGRLARYVDKAWQSRAVFIAAHLAGVNVADVDIDDSVGSVSDIADS